MTNKERAKDLLHKRRAEGLTIPEHRCTDECAPLGCYRPLLFGTINPPTFTGEDVIWGTKAAGSLVGDWDYRTGKLVSLYGLFPGPQGVVITEDYADVL